MNPSKSDIISIVLLLLGLFRPSIEMGTCPSDLKGSTPEIESIFIGRCSYFVNVLHSADCDIKSEEFNCTAIWDEFSNAILSQEPCDVSISSFDGLFQIANHTIKPNTTLFWSGTNNLAHEISRTSDYYSLEDTLVGYTVNGLLFCSAPNQSYFTTNESCPNECVTWNNPFWNGASADFARKARGYAIAILNGTRTNGAFVETSTFYRFELPELNSDRFKGLKVLLLHDLDKPKYETCKKPVTLTQLKAALDAKNITYECEDDRFEILLLMCSQDPFSRECEAIKRAISYNNSNRSLPFSGLLLFCFILYSVLVGV